MEINGSVTEYPVSLLFEILHHRRETGLLEISSPRDSGQFYFKNGELIDAVLNKAAGLEARRSAERLTDGSFEFKAVPPAEYARFVWQHSLIREQSERSSFYSGITERLAKTRRSARKTMSDTVAALQNSSTKRLSNVLIWIKRLNERVLNFISDLKYKKIFHASRINRELSSLLHRQSVYLNALMLILIGTVGITLITKGRWIEAVTKRNQMPGATEQAATVDVAAAGRSTVSENSAAAAPVKSAESVKQNDTNKRASASDFKRKTSSAPTSSKRSATDSQSNSSQTVSVLVRVEDGHVANASVIDSRAGFESYEAAALRVARQRRYPPATTRFDILTVKIKQ
jgi:hypothetical protein